MEDVETSAREHSFTIHGEPASKANSRKIVLFGKRPALIKSEKARKYVKQFEAQMTSLKAMLRSISPFTTQAAGQTLTKA